MIRKLTSREMSSISSALRCVLDKVEAATEKRKKVRYYLVFVFLGLTIFTCFENAAQLSGYE